MQILLTLPGVLWLLLPPICICHLPERLAGAACEAPRPERAPENGDHVPGCPAAKKITPNVESTERVLDDAAHEVLHSSREALPTCFAATLEVVPTRADRLDPNLFFCVWLL